MKAKSVKRKYLFRSRISWLSLLLIIVVVLASISWYWYFYRKEPAAPISEEMTCDIYNTTWKSTYGSYRSFNTLDLRDIFGDNVSSYEYIVYRFEVIWGKVPCSLYVAVNNDATGGFPINNTSNYNKLVATLNLYVEKSEAVNITHKYLQLTPPPVFPNILYELPNATGDENITFEEWFTTHNYTFHPPTINATAEGYIVEYYAWQIIGGELSYHHFELKIDGTIVSWERTILGWNVGPYITP